MSRYGSSYSSQGSSVICGGGGGVVLDQLESRVDILRSTGTKGLILTGGSR